MPIDPEGRRVPPARSRRAAPPRRSPRRLARPHAAPVGRSRDLDESAGGAVPGPTDRGPGPDPRRRRPTAVGGLAAASDGPRTSRPSPPSPPSSHSTARSTWPARCCGTTRDGWRRSRPRTWQTVEQLATVTSDDPAVGRRGGHGPGRPCAVGGGLAPADRRRGGQRRHGHLVGLPSRRIPRVLWVGPPSRWTAVSAQLVTRHGASLGAAMAETARAVIDDGDVDDVEGPRRGPARRGRRRRGGAGVLRRARRRRRRRPPDGVGHAGRARRRGRGAGRPGAHPAGGGQSPARLPADVRSRRWSRGSSTSTATARGARPPPCRSCSTTPRSAATCSSPRSPPWSTRSWPPPATSRGDGASLWSLSPVPSVLYRVLDDEAAPGGTSELLRGSRPDVRAARVARRRRRRRAGCVHRRAAGRGTCWVNVTSDVDGMRRLAAAAERAAAGPDVVAGADPSAARGRRAGRLGVRRPRRIAERRCAPGLLGQRRGEPVGGHHPRPARAGRPDHRPDRRPGHARTAPRASRRRRSSTSRTRPGVTAPRCGSPGWTSTPSASSPTSPSAASRAWPSSGPRWTSRSRTRRTRAVGRLAAGDLPPDRDPNLFLAEVMQDKRCPSGGLRDRPRRTPGRGARPLRRRRHLGLDRPGLAVRRRRQLAVQGARRPVRPPLGPRDR